MSPRKRKALLLSAIAVGVAAAAALAVYLAAFLFLLSNKKDPTSARLDSFPQYWAAYHDDPRLLKKLKGSVAASGFVCFVLIPFAFWSATQKKRPLHGAAHFANPSEVRATGLLGDKGILLAKFRKRFLMVAGQVFVILAAPTRSGKGVGVVIPNLLSWPDSVVVSDIKEQNFLITAGFRAAHGQEVYAFRPFAEDGHTHRYNPLSAVRQEARFRVGDLQAIGTVFYPTSAKSEGGSTEKFFNEKARDLFVGLGLMVMETPDLPLTCGELLRQSSGKGKPIKEYLQGIIADRDKAGRPLSDECVEALDRFLINSDNTLSGIISTFNAPLALFADPLVDAATSASDFSLADVRKRRMSIYICIPPGKLVVSRLLVNLLFTQLVELNTRETPTQNPELRVECLGVLDEFTSWDRIAVMEKAVAFIAEYGLRFLTIIQSMSQLASTYGEKEAKTLMSNHAVQVVFPPREQSDAEEYSKMLGTYTEKAESRGRSRRSFDGHGPTVSTNVSDQRRSLMLPQELREMDPSKAIVMMASSKPILCDKIVYYTDPIFQKRLLPPPALPFVDLGAHIARVQGRKRAVGAHEIVAGVDLSRLAHDVEDLPELGEEASAEEVETFVTQFFDSLGGALPARAASNAVLESEELPAASGSDTRLLDLAELER